MTGAWLVEDDWLGLDEPLPGGTTLRQQLAGLECSGPAEVVVQYPDPEHLYFGAVWAPSVALEHDPSVN